MRLLWHTQLQNEAHFLLWSLFGCPDIAISSLRNLRTPSSWETSSGFDETGLMGFRFCNCTLELISSTGSSLGSPLLTTYVAFGVAILPMTKAICSDSSRTDCSTRPEEELLRRLAKVPSGRPKTRLETCRCLGMYNIQLDDQVHLDHSEVLK